MNYNSVQEIIDAGVINAQILRNNSKNDDNNDQISAPEWLTFNGSQVRTIFVNGNSFIGFNTPTAHISVNNRDSASYYLYYEEGTLWHIIPFVKIRWSGFTSYSSTSLSYKLTYDVIIFGTGEIFIQLIDVPTSNMTGTKQIVASQTYTFDFSSSNTNISFYPTNNVGEYTGPIYEVVNISKPYTEKFLLEIDGVYNTIIGNELVPLQQSELTSQLFIDNGFESIPDDMFLAGLEDFSVLYWNSLDRFGQYSNLQVNVIANPKPQTIVSNKIDMSHISILGLKSITSEFEGDIIVSLSIDDKSTWIYWDGTQWVQTGDVALGMTKETLDSLTELELMQLYEESKFIYMRIYMSDSSQNVESILLNYQNEE